MGLLTIGKMMMLDILSCLCRIIQKHDHVDEMFNQAMQLGALEVSLREASLEPGDFFQEKVCQPFFSSLVIYWNL